MFSSRRNFIRIVLFSGLADFNFLKLSFGASTDDMALDMVDKARSHLRETDWAPSSSFGPIQKSYFCNIFVADVAREAKCATWNPIMRSGVLRSYPDPLAREWEDPDFQIKGWIVVFHAKADFGTATAKEMLMKRRPGDVVAGLGHVGIVSEVGGRCIGKVTSAATENESANGCASDAQHSNAAVIENDFSFRLPKTDGFSSPQDWENAAKQNVGKFTIRRFIGLAG